MEPYRGTDVDGPFVELRRADDPLESGLAVLRDLVSGFFWKKRHYHGLLGSHFTREDARRFAQSLTPTWLDQLLAVGRDPVEETLLRLAEQTAISATTPVRWLLSETTLNARFALGFALLTPLGAGQVLKTLCPGVAPSGRAALAMLNSCYQGKRRFIDYGQPDLLLASPNCLWIFEMKVRGGTSRASYTADQLLKTMHFASDVYDFNPSIRVAHVIVAPETRRGVVSNAHGWFVDANDPDTNASVSIQALTRARLKPRWRKRLDDPVYCSRLAETLERTAIRQVTYINLLNASQQPASVVETVNLQWSALARDSSPRERHTK